MLKILTSLPSSISLPVRTTYSESSVYTFTRQTQICRVYSEVWSSPWVISVSFWNNTDLAISVAIYTFCLSIWNFIVSNLQSETLSYPIISFASILRIWSRICEVFLLSVLRYRRSDSGTVSCFPQKWGKEQEHKLFLMSWYISLKTVNWLDDSICNLTSSTLVSWFSNTLPTAKVNHRNMKIHFKYS